MEDSGKNLGKKFVKGKWYTPEEVMEMALEKLDDKTQSVPEETEESRGEIFTTKGVMQDAANQFNNINRFYTKTIEQIKEDIQNTTFKSLEEYTGRKKKEFKKSVRDKYDSLIEEIKKVPDIKDDKLALDEFKRILKEATNL